MPYPASGKQQRVVEAFIENILRLEAVSAEAPPGALALLTALGQGENGFGGTPVGDDPANLDGWLEYCVHLATAPPLSDDFLPQTNYWIVDGGGRAIGLIRMQTQINARLLDRGGHLGYYIAPAHRGQGHGKSALRLALGELRSKGVGRALVSVETHNAASLRMVAALGGVLEDERIDAESGQAYRRFWLETAVPKR